MLRALRGRPEPEERALQVTPWGQWRDSMPTAAGMTVDSDHALKLLTVYGCVTLIADTIATLPRDVFRDNPNGMHEEVKVKPKWFDQPNPTTDMIEFITQSLTSLLLDGNAYWAYGLDGNMGPANLRVLDPLKVALTPESTVNNLTYVVEGAPYRGNLLHIKGLTRPGMLKGLSPVESARQALGIGLAASEFAGNFYRNGTTLSGVISVPGNLTMDQAKKLKEGWSRGHGGVGNAHLPGVIDNGATWQNLGVTPEQGQFLATREFSSAEIASQMFLLDPSMLGLSVGHGQNLTYANLEQRGVHLVQFTLLRWIIRLERAFSQLLPSPHYMKFNVAGLERADLAGRMQAHRIALGPNQPFETINEVRALEDLPPVPDGDTLTDPTPPPAPPTQPQDMPPMNGQQPQQKSATIHNHIQPHLFVDMQPPPVPEVHFYAESPKANITVNVPPNPELPAPIVHNHVDAPVVNVAAAEVPEVRVNVEPPPPAEVTVHVPPAPRLPKLPTPIVNVAAADVTVNVPEQQLPDIHTHVDAPIVNVPAPKAPVVHNHIEAPKTKRRVVRNKDGRIEGVEDV